MDHERLKQGVSHYLRCRACSNPTAARYGLAGNLTRETYLLLSVFRVHLSHPEILQLHDHDDMGMIFASIYARACHLQPNPRMSKCGQGS